ncbi:hypothetical protein ANN_23429 [Periplaneta americana]|uniref:Uncharacterized protein n=1 Tax=Periplaneta americana TaxID=6978 RepID=A0ABQ8SLI0_PERAM|nr:hypothetical protein ANN_23429 [Periplaneta americana]
MNVSGISEEVNLCYTDLRRGQGFQSPGSHVCTQDPSRATSSSESELIVKYNRNEETDKWILKTKQDNSSLYSLKHNDVDDKQFSPSYKKGQKKSAIIRLEILRGSFCPRVALQAFLRIRMIVHHLEQFNGGRRTCNLNASLFRWLDDDLRPERPIEVTIPENVAAVQEAIEEDRRITHRQSEELNIFVSTFHLIVNELAITQVLYALGATVTE